MPYTKFIQNKHMFNFLSNQTKSPESPDPLFATEKELILHVIEHATIGSRMYSKHALPEWKAQYTNKQGYLSSIYVCEDDRTIIGEWAETSDDEEILRAIYRNHRAGSMLLHVQIMCPKLYLNANLPDGLIECYINSPSFIIENLSEERDRLQSMLKVGFDSSVNERIQGRIDEIVVIKRKKKEDKTKNNLKAFLITASATKSVLSGNSIDDVVEATINDTVNDEVLEYMTKLLGEKK